MLKTLEDLRPDLISIGLSLYGKDVANKSADPEETLLKALDLFYEDMKMFKLLLGWCLTVHPLLHVERLLKKSSRLRRPLHPVLGAIAKKLVSAGDRRFKVIHLTMLKSCQKMKSTTHFKVPSGYTDEFLISRYGQDLEFEEFGMHIAALYPEEAKKMLSLNQIISLNQWFNVRALVGANFRSDLLYLMASKKVKNANQAAKYLDCSRETSYRLWNEISRYQGELEKLTRH